MPGSVRRYGDRSLIAKAGSAENRRAADRAAIDPRGTDLADEALDEGDIRPMTSLPQDALISVYMAIEEAEATRRKQVLGLRRHGIDVRVAQLIRAEKKKATTILAAADAALEELRGGERKGDAADPA